MGFGYGLDFEKGVPLGLLIAHLTKEMCEHGNYPETLVKIEFDMVGCECCGEDERPVGKLVID